MPSGTVTPAPSTLVASLWPAQRPRRAAAGRTGMRGVDWTRAVLLVVLGGVLLTLSAKVQVPSYPVPLTLQTLAVLVLSAAYGWRLAGTTLVAYVLEGAAGLPVFAGPSPGYVSLMGPTGGFILGFVIAGLFVGWFAEQGWDRPLARLAGLMVAGHAIVFAVGLPWLAHFTGVEKAWLLGVQPFLLATLVKTALAIALMRAGWTLIRR